MNRALKLSEPVAVSETLHAPLAADSTAREGPRPAEYFLPEAALARSKEPKFAALVEIILDLASEREPERLLELLCHRARHLIGARYATAGAIGEDGETTAYLFSSGLSGDEVVAAARSAPPPPRTSPFWPPSARRWGSQAGRARIPGPPSKESRGPFVRENGVGFNTEHSSQTLRLFYRLHHARGIEYP